jgi:hypothetical protein
VQLKNKKKEKRRESSETTTTQIFKYPKNRKTTHVVVILGSYTDQISS